MRVKNVVVRIIIVFSPNYGFRLPLVFVLHFENGRAELVHDVLPTNVTARPRQRAIYVVPHP